MSLNLPVKRLITSSSFPEPTPSTAAGQILLPIEAEWRLRKLEQGIGPWTQAYPDQSLQAQWDAMPSGGSLALRPGSYVLDQTLVLNKPGSIISSLGYQPGATLVPQFSGDVIQITSDYVGLSDLTIEPPIQPTSGAAINVMGAEGAQIFGLYLSNITLNNGWQGLYLTYVQNTRIEYVTLHCNATDYGIYAEHVIGGRFVRPIVDSADSTHAQEAYHLDTCNLTLITPVQNGVPGVSMHFIHGDDNFLWNPQLNNSYLHGLWLENTGDVGIVEPFMGTMGSSGPNYYGLYSKGSNGVRVTGGQLAGNHGGICLENCLNNGFTNTQLTSSPNGDGLLVTGSSIRCQYTGGVITHSGGYGINDTSTGPNFWMPAFLALNTGGNISPSTTLATGTIQQ